MIVRAGQRKLPRKRGVKQPPRVGKGSHRGAWADYATRLGYTVTADMGRDQIVKKVIGGSHGD